MNNKGAFDLKKVFLYGLVAGIIISISAITMVPVVGNEMDNILSNLGLRPLSNLAMMFFCFISFIYGIFLIFLYAVMKLQFGSGIKTAVISSLIVWIIAYLIGNVSLIVYGFMPVKFVFIGTLWGLLELLLGGIIGSKLYERSLNKISK
jgi:hypothetical protein